MNAIEKALKRLQAEAKAKTVEDITESLHSQKEYRHYKPPGEKPYYLECWRKAQASLNRQAQQLGIPYAVVLYRASLQSAHWWRLHHDGIYECYLRGAKESWEKFQAVFGERFDNLGIQASITLYTYLKHYLKKGK